MFGVSQSVCLLMYLFVYVCLSAYMLIYLFDFVLLFYSLLLFYSSYICLFISFIFSSSFLLKNIYSSTFLPIGRLFTACIFYGIVPSHNSLSACSFNV